MLILTFEEFNNKFNIDNNAMRDIRIKDIGKDISLLPIEIVMRDDKLDNTSENNFNIIVNLHPTDGTYCGTRFSYKKKIWSNILL